MTNPVIYATISGVAHEPTYGNIGERKRQAAGRQLTVHIDTIHINYNSLSKSTDFE